MAHATRQGIDLLELGILDKRQPRRWWYDENVLECINICSPCAFDSYDLPIQPKEIFASRNVGIIKTTEQSEGASVQFVIVLKTIRIF